MVLRMPWDPLGQLGKPWDSLGPLGSNSFMLISVLSSLLAKKKWYLDPLGSLGTPLDPLEPHGTLWNTMQTLKQPDLK